MLNYSMIHFQLGWEANLTVLMERGEREKSRQII